GGLLRTRKGRGGKPFALMMPDLDTIRRHCFVDGAEAETLSSPASPIVLLRRRSGPDSPRLADGIAPGLSRLGVMLPYTPLHHLLMARVARPLVMTSANLSEEPIVTDNSDAVGRLGRIADLLMIHDRDILTRCDDSVLAVDPTGAVPVRRARGYAPFPVRLEHPVGSVLACGAEEKNTFCLARDRDAFLSQHIGDLENAETLAHFERTITLMRRLFRFEPDVLACDMHPEYLSTKYALALADDTGLPLVQVQHHHAHVAACLADNDVRGPVIGVALDGTGYGTDGTIWGGEFLAADARSFERLAWLEPVRMPGGAAAIRRPWRMAVAHLRTFVPELLGVASEAEGRAATPALLENPGRFAEQGDLRRTGLASIPQREVQVVLRQLETGLNSPFTSSAGRLFDAVSAVLGICAEIRYEAQAAIELEEAALRADPTDVVVYPVEGACDGPVKLGPLWAALADDLRKGAPTERIALRFHRSVAVAVVRTCVAIRSRTDLGRVALSGGVFQNRLLMTLLDPP
ncbi:MAG: carbamoyltransferase HypF, partial [Deltaproteobacteria bacterium]|nr:carbamoyltransferase HypF [Deltaproteobacteria bacterium]